MEVDAELLSPAEADWPPELRLPPPPSEPPPAQAMGMDDSQFLGSIMGEPPPPQQQAQAEAPVGVKRKRGRPPKNRDGSVVVATKAAAKPVRRKEDEEEVVCFICFDGGNLVVCDRRGCPKVYHPACIKREESFFQSRSKWNCGWHICSSCEKAVHYMCYTCTYSVCKVCIKQGKFFSVRGTKGFCDTCFGTILLIESKDRSTEIRVDFDDQNSWEYLFKLYWLDLKGKLSLTLEELTNAKSRWNVPSSYARKEKDESSDDLYDANNDDDAGSDCSSGKRKRTNSSRKRARKRQKANSDCSIAAKKDKIATGDAGSLPMKVPSEEVSLPVDAKWASPELLEFVGHMRDGDQSFISQFDVQALLLDYIKENNLRDPRRKSQIICDSRLHRLFRKTRVAHFEMLKLLEMHFVVSEASTVNNDNQGVINPNSAQIDASGYSDMAAKLCPDRRRRMHRKIEREPNANLEDYAAVDMHNINLMYLRRSLMEDLIDDATFSDKVAGAFVRIRISGVGQKQDMYRLVKVIGTHKVSEKYSIGKKMTNFALEILNLDKKEIITMDTISNQDFIEEECKRLRQSMKCGLITRIKVGDVQEKAKIFLSVRVNDWLENEKQRLGHLRDRASETGRRKELRECVEKLQLLNTSEERTRRINEILEVHVDSHMDPDYESAEEIDDKKAVEQNVNWTRSDAFFSPIKVKYSNTVQNHAPKNSDVSRHPKTLSKQCSIRKSGAGRNSQNFHSTIGSDIPKSGTNGNSTMYEAASLSSSGVTLSSDIEPEKVWHYKDPSGNVQGPFTLLQLSKWTGYFPPDLRVWLTFESEERSLLLTEVLSKQPKDLSQVASVTTSSKATLAGSGQNGNSPNVDLNNALSPVGYSMLNSSEITVRYTKYAVPERVSMNSLEDRLSLSTSSVPPKDADTLNGQVQTKHSGFPCGQSDLHHGVQGRRSGEWNNRRSSGLWSPTLPQTSCSGQSSVESHHNQHARWSQVQHDSKSSLQAGSVKDLNSRPDYSQNLPTQRIGRDVPSPVFAWSPSESRTASSQHEGSCFSSTANPSTHDELHSSIASAKAKSCAPATPVEDRGSSSPSGMLSHSERIPICSPQSAPASASEICKEFMNQQKILEADASNASANQSAQSKIFPESSPDNQDNEREYPSPTPISVSKEPAVDYSGSTSVPEICKMEIINQQKTLEADASNGSVNQSPQSKTFPESSPDNQDIEREYPSPTPRSESNEPAVDHSGSTSVVPEICKMVIMNQKKTLEADASNASVNQSHQSKIFPESSDNQDVECEYLSPTPRSESKEPAVDHSESTSVVPEICKMVIMNQQKTLEADASNVSVNQSKIFPESSPDNQDVEREYLSPTPRSESKEPAVDHSGSTSVVPEICKMVIMNQQKTLEADASNASVNQSHQSKIFPESSPDNQDVEHEYLSPTPRYESKEPAVDHSESTSVVPEICKMVVMNQQKTLEADASNASVNQSKIFPESSPDNQDVEREYLSPTPRSESKEPAVDHSESTSVVPEICKMNQQKTLEAYQSNASVDQSESKTFPESSPDNQDVGCEYPSPTRRSESKEPAVDQSGSTSVEPKNVAIKIPDHNPVAFVLPKSGPPSGNIDATESVFNLENIDLKGENSNVQKELYIESTVVTRENVAIDPASCVESIDVSDVLKSLVEQRCGILYMDGTAALEDLLTASAEEEPQCSSPIALSPWGEPDYYQGDAVDSALWGVQDDMWSLPSPTPALQHSSDVENDGKGTACVINEVTATQGNNEVQRGPTPGEKKVEPANSGASTAWGLVEQVKSEANDVSVSSIVGSTGLGGWQPSANGSSNVDTAWSTSRNPSLSSCYETAAPSSRSSHEASRKQECTYLNAASAGEALGNAKSWNPSTGNANRGSQRSHHNANRDRYSQISESWLLSSNYSRSRSDGFGRGGSSRTVQKGQTQRKICKFHEGGYCLKGASCKYLHP